MELAIAPEIIDQPSRALDASLKQHPLVTVIEDEAIVLAGYQMLFESWGYTVIAAASADQAIETLRLAAHPPDIIFADYRLKDGLNGAQAIRQIQGLFGPDIPGILVTGDSSPDRLRDAAASGLPIMHKPVKSIQLRALVSRYLDQD